MDKITKKTKKIGNKKISNITDIFDSTFKKNTIKNFVVSEKYYDKNYCKREAHRIFEAMTNRIPYGVFKYLIILLLEYGFWAYKELNIKYNRKENVWEDR